MKHPHTNVRLYCTEQDGSVVESSVREVHNVLTQFGREWLTKLMVWDLFADPDDIPVDQRRLRWVGLGSGMYDNLQGVTQLKSPLTVTLFPDEYIRRLHTGGGTFTRQTAVKVESMTVFPGISTDFDHHGSPVVFQEAGLYADVDLGAGPVLDISIATNPRVAYASFPPVGKTLAQNLNVTWSVAV